MDLNDTNSPIDISRRDFLKGTVVAAAAAGSIVPVVRIAGAMGRTNVHTNTVGFQGTELLGRPTDNSIMLNVVADTDCEAYVEYGTTPGAFLNKTAVAIGDAEAPLTVLVDNLKPGSRYYYRLMYREKETKGKFQARPEHTFHTQRNRDDAFVFTIISDSHLGDTPHALPEDVPAAARTFNDPALYRIACRNVQKDSPDLHFDLGDTFILTRLETGDFNGIRRAYMAQRPYMGLFSHSSPVFLALGNHEEEEGWNLDDAGEDPSESKTIMSANARKKYYLNPKPDGFYTGNMDDSQKEIGGDHLKEDYYAFEWGCALFVVLDPFWYTTTKPYVGIMGGESDDDDVPPADRWRWTLGKDQYDWLKRTLEQSKARFKFVMSHQVAGGCACAHDLNYGRGGEKAAHSHEWGADPKEFAANRPGWSSDKSIHQLFLENNVDIFFHGHDHVYAMEEVDGMIYQECPFPANPGYGIGFGAYQNDPPGTVVKANSGHLRVSVSPEKVTVDYVRAFLPGDGSNGSVEHSYSIPK